MKRQLNTVLLVDDDGDSNYAHQRIISEHGCTRNLSIATGGEEALQYLISRTKDGFSHPDLILLDINMPGMDGWEFLEEYRKLNHQEKARVVIVMLTASLSAADRKKATTFKEINGYMNKPLGPETLETILHEHFPECL